MHSQVLSGAPLCIAQPISDRGYIEPDQFGRHLTVGKQSCYPMFLLWHRPIISYVSLTDVDDIFHVHCGLYLATTPHLNPRTVRT